MNPATPVPIPRGHSGLRRLVPLTELRHFYHLLRDTLVSTASHVAVAEEVRRRPEPLQDLVERSRRHFDHYDNRDDDFHDRSSPGTLSSNVLASPRPVHRLLRDVYRQGIRLPAHPDFDADFVDYEISPIRTTSSAEYENGMRCETGGGVDILLANSRDRLPVLAEEKGHSDANLFLALIQALTYAVEFSTPAQRERLNRVYPGRFAWSPSEPVLDIYLVLVEAPRSRFHSTFLRLVDETCEQLLRPGTPVAGMVRRITCLQSDESEGGTATYAMLFQHPLPRGSIHPTDDPGVAVTT